MITLSVIPIGNSVLAQIEATYPAGSDVDHVHCVIVLGGGASYPEQRSKLHGGLLLYQSPPK